MCTGKSLLYAVSIKTFKKIYEEADIYDSIYNQDGLVNLILFC